MPLTATNGPITVNRKLNTNESDISIPNSQRPHTSTSSIFPIVLSPNTPIKSSESLEQQSSLNLVDEWIEPQRQKCVSNNVEPSHCYRKSGLAMQICTQTWLADSHGLFDYENRTTVSHEFKCTCKCDSYQINRTGTDITFLSTEESQYLTENNTVTESIAQIVWVTIILPQSKKPKSESLWLVVRNSKYRPVIIRTGDVLKFGRFKLKIKEVVTTQEEAAQVRKLYVQELIKTFIPLPDDEDKEADCETVAPESGDNLEIDNLSNSVLDLEDVDVKIPEFEVSNESKSEAVQENNRICRICLCDTENICNNFPEEYNPLISPCECNGSMKWVHLQCLRTWIAGRLNIKSDSVAFFWKFLSCELCKLTYPTMIDAPALKDYDNVVSEPNGKVQKMNTLIQLFEIPKPLVPYTILELKSHQAKGFYVVSLANNRIARLGRGHESDIRLADISVSRLHSILRFESGSNLLRQTNSIVSSSGFATYPDHNIQHGCFVVEDNRSKFGTLIELKEPLRLDSNQLPVSIQVGRTVITISIKRRWRLRFPTCMRHNTSDIYSISRQSHFQPNPKSNNNNSYISNDNPDTNINIDVDNTSRHSFYI